MSDTLYIQTEQNVEVHHPHVYLQDIAKLSCSNAKILNRLRVMPVANLDPDKPGRYVICAMDLIKGHPAKGTGPGHHQHWRAYLHHHLSEGRQRQCCSQMVQGDLRVSRHLFRRRLFHYDL